MMQNRQYVVVDDDHLNNMLCSIYIRKQDPDAVINTFTDPELGLKFLKGAANFSFDQTIVFLDINMPSMSGWEFMEHFGQFDQPIKSKIRVYFLTSSVDQRDSDRAAKIVEISGIATKPLKLEKLFLL